MKASMLRMVKQKDAETLSPDDTGAPWAAGYTSLRVPNPDMSSEPWPVQSLLKLSVTNLHYLWNFLRKNQQATPGLNVVMEDNSERVNFSHFLK